MITLNLFISLFFHYGASRLRRQPKDVGWVRGAYSGVSVMRVPAESVQPIRGFRSRLGVSGGAAATVRIVPLVHLL